MLLEPKERFSLFAIFPAHSCPNKITPFANIVADNTCYLCCVLFRPRTRAPTTDSDRYDRKCKNNFKVNTYNDSRWGVEKNETNAGSGDGQLSCHVFPVYQQNSAPKWQVQPPNFCFISTSLIFCCTRAARRNLCVGIRLVLCSPADPGLIGPRL